MNALVDNGAEKSFLGYDAAKLVAEYIQPQITNFTYVNGTTAETCGIVRIDMNVDGLQEEFQLRVTNNFDYECLLGFEYLKKFEIVLDHPRRYWIGYNSRAYRFEDSPSKPGINSEEFHAAGLQEINDSKQDRLLEFIEELWVENR